MSRGPPYPTNPQEPPFPEDVLALMDADGCYVASDLAELFNADPTSPDTTRSTVRHRLELLVDRGQVERFKHESNAVTYHLIAAE